MRFHLIQHSGLLVCGEWERYGRGDSNNTQLRASAWRSNPLDVRCILHLTLLRRFKGAKCAFENQKCKMHFWFWQHRGKNVRHVVPGTKFAFCNLDLPGRWRRNVPLPPSAGAEHFDRHQSERKFFVLVLVSGTMTQAKDANGQFVNNVADKMSVTLVTIQSCIFAIFSRVTVKSCIIAIFLRSWPTWPYNRDGRTNWAAPRNFQILFENGSALPPVFLLLVRGCFGCCENHRPFTTKVHRHNQASFRLQTTLCSRRLVFCCLDKSTNIISRVAAYRKKGRQNIATIQPAAENTAILYRRIGSTTYKVRVHFSDTAQETMNDKILHLIKKRV